MLAYQPSPFPLPSIRSKVSTCLRIPDTSGQQFLPLGAPHTKARRNWGTTHERLLRTSFFTFCTFTLFWVHRIHLALFRNHRIPRIGPADRFPRPGIGNGVTIATVIRAHLKPVYFTAFAPPIRPFAMQTPEENRFLVPRIINFLAIFYGPRHPFRNFFFWRLEVNLAMTQIHSKMDEAVLRPLSFAANFL